MRATREINILMPIIGFGILLQFFIFPSQIYADVLQSRGQTVYISVYPKIEQHNQRTHIYPRSILTIRNTDLRYPITVSSISYHDSTGSVKQHVLTETLVLKPLASHAMRFEAKQLEAEGMGGCFIIKWKSTETVNAPLTDLMILFGRSGFSYTLIVHGIAIEDEGN